MKKVAAFIGRMQLPHRMHLHLISQAFKHGEKVIIVLGSSYGARRPQNPFKHFEIETMIRLTLSEEENKRVTFIPVRDYYDDKLWLKHVVKKVEQTATEVCEGEPFEISLISHIKDDSGYYQKMFKNWGRVDVATSEDMAATTMRRIFFGRESKAVRHGLLKTYVHTAVLDYLFGWETLEASAFNQIRNEIEYIEKEKAKVACHYPYKHTTADAVVRIGDYVMLIRRGKTLGKGLLAIPGGHIEEYETFFDAALRECIEETSLPYSRELMVEHLADHFMLDAAKRSALGRVISGLYYFDFSEESIRPAVKAGDDANKIEFIHIDELHKYEEEFFDDHFLALHRIFKFEMKD